MTSPPTQPPRSDLHRYHCRHCTRHTPWGPNLETCHDLPRYSRETLPNVHESWLWMKLHFLGTWLVSAPRYRNAPRLCKMPRISKTNVSGHSCSLCLNRNSTFGGDALPKCSAATFRPSDRGLQRADGNLTTLGKYQLSIRSCSFTSPSSPSSKHLLSLLHPHRIQVIKSHTLRNGSTTRALVCRRAFSVVYRESRHRAYRESR